MHFSNFCNIQLYFQLRLGPKKIYLPDRNRVISPLKGMGFLTEKETEIILLNWLKHFNDHLYVSQAILKHWELILMECIKI